MTSQLLSLVRSGFLRTVKLARQVARTNYLALNIGKVKPECKVCSGKTRVISAYGRVFYRCCNCSFVFALDFAPSKLNSGMGMEGSWSGPGGGGYREYYLVRKLLEELGAERFLLFGTGNTPTFEMLKEEGVDVVGCDISPDVVKYKQNLFGAEKFISPVDVPSMVKFDGIVAVEVFEHLAEPNETFSTLLNQLRPGGILCGTTDFYQGGNIEDGNTPGYMSLGGHIAYWSTKSMGRMVGKFNRSLATFEMIRPGSVLPDEKYGQLYPNKRVFFIFESNYHKQYFSQLKLVSPILPIDKP